MNKHATSCHDHHGERGSGLVLAVLVLALLTAMGVALMFLSQTELRMTRANMDSKGAFQFAESGVEDGRTTLFMTNGDGPFSDDLQAAAGLNNVIDFDADAVTVTYDSAGNATAIGGYGDDRPVRDLVGLGLPAFVEGSYAAFLTNDAADGETNLADSNDRVMITAIGYGVNRSKEIVEAIVEPTKPLITPPPAAITLLGPNPNFDNGNSNAQSHDGNDCGGGPQGVPGLYAPVVGAVGNSSLGQIQGTLDRPDTFGSGPFNGLDTVGDLSDPTNPIVSGSGLGTIDPEWTDCLSLKAMVESLIIDADYYCNSDIASCTVPGTGNPGDIVVIDGDGSTPGSTTFSGILLVTGELTFDGNSEWNGILLVVGEGRMVRSGGGNGTPSGSVVIANIDPSPTGLRTDKNDWCTGTPAFMPSSYQTTGAGNSNVEYCSAYINVAKPVTHYKVVEFQQR